MAQSSRVSIHAPFYPCALRTPLPALDRFGHGLPLVATLTLPQQLRAIIRVLFRQAASTAGFSDGAQLPNISFTACRALVDGAQWTPTSLLNTIRLRRPLMPCRALPP